MANDTLTLELNLRAKFDIASCPNMETAFEELKENLHDLIELGKQEGLFTRDSEALLEDLRPNVSVLNWSS